MLVIILAVLAACCLGAGFATKGILNDSLRLGLKIAGGIIAFVCFVVAVVRFFKNH